MLAVFTHPPAILAIESPRWWLSRIRRWGPGSGREDDPGSGVGLGHLVQPARRVGVQPECPGEALGEQLTGDDRADGRDRFGQVRARDARVGGCGELRVPADTDG